MQVSNGQVQNGECIKMDYLTKHLWAISRSIYIFSLELSVLTLFACKTMVTFTVIYKEVVSLTSVITYISTQTSWAVGHFVFI